MSPRIRAQRDEPILFAHRGASADAPENTIDAFRLGLELGANGLESDVWLTTDGVPVLVHDDRLGRVARRRRVGETAVTALPPHIPTLTELFEAVGTAYELSLDIKDPAAFQPTLDAVREAGMVDRTWMCHPDLGLLASWRSKWSDARLVHSTKLARMDHGPERHAATLYKNSIDAVNLRHGEWQGGLTALFHRFGLLCFGWDAQLQRVGAELLDMGVDAIYGDNVRRLLDARAAIY